MYNYDKCIKNIKTINNTGVLLIMKIVYEEILMQKLGTSSKEILSKSLTPTFSVIQLKSIIDTIDKRLSQLL